MTKSELPSQIVIFGAGGFVGRNIVEALQGRVSRIVGITASGRAVPGCSQTVAARELHAFKISGADTAVIHAAAFRYDPFRMDMIQNDILVQNVDLANAVYAFCAETKITEVRLASSVAVYGSDLPVMDDTVPLDLNREPFEGEAFYAWSKRWAERLASLYKSRFGINTVAFRLGNPYGPFDSVDINRAHVAPAFVMKALNADPVFSIRGDANVERDFIYVGDVVEVFLRSLDWRDQNDVFNLCTGRSTSLYEFASTALTVAGSAKVIQSGAPGAFGPKARRASSEKVRKAFGVDFRDLEAGLKPTIEWYRGVL